MFVIYSNFVFPFAFVFFFIHNVYFAVYPIFPSFSFILSHFSYDFSLQKIPRCRRDNARRSPVFMPILITNISFVILIIFKRLINAYKHKVVLKGPHSNLENMINLTLKMQTLFLCAVIPPDKVFVKSSKLPTFVYYNITSKCFVFLLV